MNVRTTSGQSVISATLLLLTLIILGYLVYVTLEAFSGYRKAVDDNPCSLASAALVWEPNYRAPERGPSQCALMEGPHFDEARLEQLHHARQVGDEAWAEGVMLDQSLTRLRLGDFALRLELKNERLISVRFAKARLALDKSISSGRLSVSPEELFWNSTVTISMTRELLLSKDPGGSRGRGALAYYQKLRYELWKGAEFEGCQRALLAHHLASNKAHTESGANSLVNHQEDLLHRLVLMRDAANVAVVGLRVVRTIYPLSQSTTVYLTHDRKALAFATTFRTSLDRYTWLTQSTDILERLNGVANACSDIFDTKAASRKAAYTLQEFGFLELLLLSVMLFLFVVTRVSGIFSRLANELAERRNESIVLQVYQRIFSCTPDHIVLFDRDGRYRLVNDSYLCAHGISAEEILGRAPSELLGGDVFKTVNKEHFELALANKISQYEAWFYCSAIGPRYMSVTYFPYRTHQSGLDGVVVSSRDITALKQVEEALAESERELRLIADTIPGMLVRYDRETRIQFFNKTYAAWLDLSPERIMGQKLQEVLGKEICAQFLPEFARALKGEVRSFERAFPGKEGEERWIQVTMVPELDVNQEVVGIIALGSDITERRLMEVQLRASQAGFRNVVDKNPIGIVVTDPGGRTLFTNPAAQEMLLSENFAALPPPGTCTELVISAPEASRGFAEMTVTETEWEDSPAHLLMLHDITWRKGAEARIETLAFTDTLTGLANRLPFQDRLDQALRRAKRCGMPLAVLLIDIDHFKDVNDTLGHSAGDELLMEMSQRMLHCVRKFDSVARFGGDEFVVLLEDLENASQAEAVAQRLLTTCRRKFTLGVYEFNLSTSIGISHYPGSGEDAETLIRCADTAMYLAKARGRDCVVTYEHDFGARLSKRVKLESELHLALEREEFLLHYQPQVNMQDGEIVGVEALLRWNHPIRGLISPGEFIPILEDTGLIVPVGEWVLHEATMQAVQWHEDGLPELTMAINVSPKQLSTRQLLAQVRKALVETGIDPRKLELEITESSLIANPASAAEMLKGLKELGVWVAIDDFGTGYSSLSYLTQFSIDRLKIDRSFIRDVPMKPNECAIVEAIIAMARALGLNTTAEGVETEEQLQFLRDNQCRAWQGFLFSVPLTAEEMTKKLRAREKVAALALDGSAQGQNG